MAFVHGSKARFLLGSVATPGTPVDVSQYIYSITLPRTIDSAETSVFGNTFKTYVPGLANGTISISGRYDPTFDATMYGLLGITGVGFTWNPQGTASGLPSYGGSGFFTNYQPQTPVSDTGSFTATFQISSAIDRTVQA